ncbi:DUF6630 family protein [Pinirhizobacter soli]|uniref:DUF6630 family protein n=1 Tax=Pinirhizobacter soli TaxID=2786953 RepID=UPI002029D278|nr:hypothetical protein [Pinirhizobacter soli]
MNHEYDPDQNFHDDEDGDGEELDASSVEGLVWQLLLLINPGDEDTAMQQFAQVREAGMGEDAEATLLAIRDAIDWRSGFHVAADEPRQLIDAVEELVSRYHLTIDWGGDADDDDFIEGQDVPSLLSVAADEIAPHNYKLWTWQTVSGAYAGWMTAQADGEPMLQVAHALGIDVRPAADA